MFARFLPEIDLPRQRCVCAISFVFPVVEPLSSRFCLALGEPRWLPIQVLFHTPVPGRPSGTFLAGSKLV